MTQQTAIHPPTYGNPTFDHGVRHGISWHLTGDEEYRKPTAQLIVDFIRDNFLEPNQEGFLDEDRLTDNAGFLVGWIVGEYVCNKQ
jgi:hypothetical protein